MAKIIDPDDLVVSSSVGNLGVDGNIWLDVSAKTFALAAYGDLVLKDGVTGNAIWAKFVDLWTSSAYNKYPFPMNIIDARSGQYIFGQDPGGSYNGWKPADDTTRQAIRDAGWSEYSGLGVLNRQYVGMIALASGFPTGAQFYYQRATTDDASDFTFDDAPNEAIQVFGDSSNGDFDKRAYFKLFCREYNYTYDDAVLGDVGESGTGAFKVALPIAVGAETKITDNDTDVSTNSPYTDIKVNYFSQAFTRDVDSASSRSFGIVIDIGSRSGVDGSAPGGASVLTTAAGGMTIDEFAGGVLTIYEGTDKNVEFPIVSNTATTITVTGTIASGSNLSFTAIPSSPVLADLDEVYTKIQYLLRQTSNINNVNGGTSVKGNTAAMLLNFVGDSLKCGYFVPTNPAGGGTGVLVQGLQSKDVNSIVFYDNSGVSREFPYSSVGTLNFNAFLTSGGAGYFRMYFTTNPTGDYGEATAVTVNDADGEAIEGAISGSSIPFTFDYTNNNQGGRTPNTEAGVTVVAGNPGHGKPVVATGTITASKALSFTLTAEQDRGYIA
jgi:hypothetical protein